MNSTRTWLSFFGVFAVVLISRLFFLSDGYGVEEDSWGLVVNAYEMKSTGHYCASRFPGHPLQEYVYRLIYDQTPFVYNLLSALFSAFGAAVFHRILRKLEPASALAGAAALAFTPVVYIAGVSTIDYAWSMCFVLLAFSALLDRRFLVAGIFIGIAAACRITSLVFVLPFVWLVYDSKNRKLSWQNMLALAVPAGFIAIISYIPAWLQYGKAFFDYSDQFPYPPLSKILYKASIGVFGLTGTLAVIAGFVSGIRNWKQKKLAETVSFPVQHMLWACLLVILLHLVAYFRLPQKAAYMMPVVPFVIVFLALTLQRKFFIAVSILMVTASFLFSINLTDSLRGAAHSDAAIKFHAAGQEIFFDPLSGPVFSEQSKRRNKLEYAEKVLRFTDTTQQKSFIICGWWYNELLTEHLHGRRQRGNVLYRFYAEEKEMRDSMRSGWTIYYLPEQNLYNDQMFGQSCTDSLAAAFPLK